jgi:hypothetical protein
MIEEHKLTRKFQWDFEISQKEPTRDQGHHNTFNLFKPKESRTTFLTKHGKLQSILTGNGSKVVYQYKNRANIALQLIKKKANSNKQ